MKIYVEAIEQGDVDTRDVIQDEIIDESEAEINKGLVNVKKEEISGKTYQYRKHLCYHDEGDPCTVEVI